MTRTTDLPKFRGGAGGKHQHGTARTLKQRSLFEEQPAPRPELPAPRRVSRDRILNLLALASFVDLTTAEHAEIDAAFGAQEAAQ